MRQLSLWEMFKLLSTNASAAALLGAIAAPAAAMEPYLSHKMQSQ